MCKSHPPVIASLRSNPSVINKKIIYFSTIIFCYSKIWIAALTSSARNDGENRGNNKKGNTIMKIFGLLRQAMLQ
jgi:hypothetical protein